MYVCEVIEERQYTKTARSNCTLTQNFDIDLGVEFRASMDGNNCAKKDELSNDGAAGASLIEHGLSTEENRSGIASSCDDTMTVEDTGDDNVSCEQVSPHSPSEPQLHCNEEKGNKKDPLSPQEKIKVHFVPVGNAPIMKRTKFQIGTDGREKKFASLNVFLRKILKLTPDQALFLYLNAAFVPNSTESLRDLNDCFATARGELVIHYALQEAWG